MAYLVNAFQIPNDLVDRLLLELSPNALKCYLVIVRKTIGWGKEFDAISASQFSKLTGIRKTDTIWRAIRELKELNIIEDVATPGKPTKFKVTIKTYPENGDTPKNLSPHSKGVTPTPKKGDTLKRGTQNLSSLNPNKLKEEEEDGYEAEIVTGPSSLPLLIVPLVMEHLQISLIEQAIDLAIKKLAKKSPFGYRRRLLEGLASGEESWVNTVLEFVKQIETSQSLPMNLMEKRKIGEFQNSVKNRIELMKKHNESHAAIITEVGRMVRDKLNIIPEAELRRIVTQELNMAGFKEVE